MKKNSRNIISRNVLIFALILTVFVPTLLLLGGCPTSVTQDGIQYTIYDSYAEVNYFIGNGGAIVCEVPSEVEYEGTVYPVKAVRPYERGSQVGLVNHGYASEIILPASVNDFDYNAYETRSSYGSGLEHLQRITVDPDNSEYSSVDGVLFNKTQSKLLYFPRNLQADSFTIPKATWIISTDSILWQNTTVPCMKVADGNEKFSAIDGVLFDFSCEEMLYYPLNKREETFVIPKEMQIFNPISMFWSNEYLKKIEVDSESVYYKSVDNVLYSYDGSELIYRPADEKVTYFAIPSTVSVVSYNALPGIRCLFVPKSVTLFMEFFVDATHTLRYVDHIYFESDSLPNYVTKDYFRGELHFGVTLEEFQEAVQ